NHSRHCYDGEQNRQQRQHGIRKFPCVLSLIAREITREYGNEDRTDRSFSDETAKQIGDAISDRIGIVRGSRSKKEGDPGVSDITQNSAQYRGGADDRGGPEQVSVFTHGSNNHYVLNLTSVIANRRFVRKDLHQQK